MCGEVLTEQVAATEDFSFFDGGGWGRRVRGQERRPTVQTRPPLPLQSATTASAVMAGVETNCRRHPLLGTPSRPASGHSPPLPSSEPAAPPTRSAMAPSSGWPLSVGSAALLPPSPLGGFPPPRPRPPPVAATATAAPPRERPARAAPTVQGQAKYGGSSKVPGLVPGRYGGALRGALCSLRESGALTGTRGGMGGLVGQQVWRDLPAGLPK